MTRGPAPTGQFFPGSRRKPIEHGTIGGYRAHYRHREPMCEPCRAAERRRRGYKGPQKTAVCGTRSGYDRHIRRGEQPCAECRAATAGYVRQWRRLGLPAGDRRHGTLPGYERGCRCDPCKQAKAVDNRHWYERRRTAS